MSKKIFVFGSNQAGVHGAGAARTAVEKFSAVMGKGWGIQGNSYAIPTKDVNIQTLPLKTIRYYVVWFLGFAEACENLKFYVTRIGCGLAGYSDEDIAPMFKNASKNCVFDIAWKEFLGNGFEYFEGEL